MNTSDSAVFTLSLAADLGVSGDISDVAPDATTSRRRKLLQTSSSRLHCFPSQLLHVGLCWLCSILHGIELDSAHELLPCCLSDITVAAVGASFKRGNALSCSSPYALMSDQQPNLQSLLFEIWEACAVGWHHSQHAAHEPGQAGVHTAKALHSYLPSQLAMFMAKLLKRITCIICSLMHDVDCDSP